MEERGEMMVIMVTLAEQEASVLLRGAGCTLLIFDVRLTGAASERKAEFVALVRRHVLVGTALRSVPTAALYLCILRVAVEPGRSLWIRKRAQWSAGAWSLGAWSAGMAPVAAVCCTACRCRAVQGRCRAGGIVGGVPAHMHDAMDAALSHKSHAVGAKSGCSRHSARDDGRSVMQSIDGTAGKYTKGGRGGGVYVVGRDAVVGSRALGATVCWMLRTLTLHYLRVVAMYAAAAGAVLLLLVVCCTI